MPLTSALMASTLCRLHVQYSENWQQRESENIYDLYQFQIFKMQCKSTIHYHLYVRQMCTWVIIVRICCGVRVTLPLINFHSSIQQCNTRQFSTLLVFRFLDPISILNKLCGFIRSSKVNKDIANSGHWQYYNEGSIWQDDFTITVKGWCRLIFFCCTFYSIRLCFSHCWKKGSIC